ncbi:Rhs-family protein, partial [hydrothermal vent metagenome]
LVKETGFDGRVQQYTYNKAGHLIKHQDGNRVITEYERDGIGQMLTRTCRDINNKQLKEQSQYRYDPKGRLTESINQDQWLKFEFDSLGNLKKEHQASVNDKGQRISASRVKIEYAIQWPNKRSQIILPDGQTIDYIYGEDKNKALEKIQFNGESITEIHRDSLGREMLRSQGEVVTETEYDPMGRLQKQQAFNLARKQKVIQREYAYNNFGNLSQLTDGNSETRYIYDLLDRLEKTEGIETEVFDFDPAGNIVGINETRIKGEKKQVSGNRLAMQGDKKFTYDERGNLIKEARGKGGKLETEFEYNLQNQLIKVVKNNQTMEYKYDPLGRRIEKKDAFGTTKYLWAGDQLAQESRNKIKKTYIYEPLSFKPVALVQDNEVYHYHLDHLGTP